MTINIYTIVWNNEFILPHFLAHYEKFADTIFIIDDHSTDRTAEIAKAHPKVAYQLYRYHGLNEDEFNETFEFLYKNNPCDKAMVVDSDEFIHAPEGKDMKEHLEIWEDSGVIRTTGYMMVGKSGKLEDCKKVRMKSWDKPIIFDAHAPNIKFGDGRHTVNVTSWPSDFELWHYKYPSRGYYIERNTEGYKRIAGMSEGEQAKRLKMGLAWYDAHV